MEAKLKHLEFVQAAISRMAGNSFLLKGWAVTLASAILALTFKELDALYLVASAVAVAFMWMLDGYYLAQERAYRGLFDHIRKTDETAVDFSMNAKPYWKKFQWAASTFSVTLGLLYGGLLLIHGVVLIFFLGSC